MKNWTLPENPDSFRPLMGSSRMPSGRSPTTSTPSGPSSEMAKRILKPPWPAIVRPPSTPTKNTRSATAVSRSSGPMMLPSESSFRMPPSSPAVISPPNRLPVMETLMDSISVMGNLPSWSSPRSMRTPSTAPDTVRFGMPLISSTAAERMIEKRSGWACRSSH